MDTTWDSGPASVGPTTVLEPPATADLVAERRHRRTLVWSLVGGAAVLLLAALAWVVYNRMQTSSALVALRTVVQRESLRGEVVAPPNKQAVINCQCSAPVARVFASVGQTVRAGDILVELSYPNARAAFDSAQDQLRLAQAAYDGARSTYLADVNSARRRQARARQVAASSRREILQEERPTGFQQGTGERAVQEAARNGLAAEEAQIELEQASVAAGEAQQRLNEYLVPYQQRLEAARANLAEARQGLSAAWIRTPISGQVIELNAQRGQSLGDVPDKLVAMIADLSALTVHAELTPEQRGRLVQDAPAQIYLTALPQEVLVGKVSSISTALGERVVKGERELREIAVVSFVNRQGVAKPGMAAQVVVEVDRADNAPAVPIGAVDYDADGQPIVRVRREGRWVETLVELGPTDGIYRVIYGGIPPGTRVQVRRERERDPVEPLIQRE